MFVHRKSRNEATLSASSQSVSLLRASAVAVIPYVAYCMRDYGVRVRTAPLATHFTNWIRRRDDL